MGWRRWEAGGSPPLFVIGFNRLVVKMVGAGMGATCEWDEFKADSNEPKHGVSFEEAATLFEDPLSITIRDEAHSGLEERFVDIGESSSGRLLIVVYTERDETIRIISCRPATSAERRAYEQR